MFDTFRSKHPPSDTVKKREGRLWLMVFLSAARLQLPTHFPRRGVGSCGLAAAAYSHSMVPGGLLVMSSTTRLTSGTSLVMRVEMRSSTS